ncbi:MAG: immunoglobulin-like domain-containing protein [Bacteroidota bacterium]
MRNKIFLIFSLTLLFVCGNFLVNAQTPTFFTGNVNAPSNGFPFNVATGKGVHYLIAPGELTGAVAGNITHFYVQGTAGVTSSFTGLTIRFSQTSVTTLPTGVLYSGPFTTAINAANVTATSTAAGWMQFTLQTPFYYDPTQSLVVEITQCSTTGGFTVTNVAKSGMRRCWNVSTCTMAYSGQDANLFNCGVDIVQGPPGGGPQVPALASFVYNPSIDTAWIQSPYTFVNTSNNLVRSYWDVVSYSSVGPNGPYTAWNAPRLCGPSPNGASGCYIDTTSLNFKYTFPQRGWYKVRLKARGAVAPLDSIEKTVYADTPTLPPVIDFFADKRIVGIFDQASLFDISNYGPNQWSWSTNPACVTCGLFQNSFSPNEFNPNPKFNAFDGGTYDLCLTASNIRGSSTLCKPNYLRVVPGYLMCNGSDSVARVDEGVVMLSTVGGTYLPGTIGSCSAGFRISACADSITLVAERYRFRNSDTLDVRINGLNGTILRKYGGNTFSTINDSLKTIRIAGGEVFLRMRLSPPSGTAGPNDSGFAIRWFSKPASYGAPKASFIVPDTLFSGYRARYTNTTQGTNASFAWDTDGDGAFGIDQIGMGKIDSTVANPSQTFTNSGTQPITRRIGLIARNCRGADTARKDVVIMPVVQIPVSNFTTNRTVGFTTDTFRLQDRSTNGANQWQWVFTPPNVTYLENTTQNSQNPVVFLNSATQYNVTLTATNQLGSNTHTKTSYLEALAYTSPNTANPIPTNTDIGISRVVLNNIDTSTALQSPIYLNLSNIKRTTLFRGVNYTIETYRNASSDPMTTKVWIDLNRNARFNDAGELIVEEYGQNKVKTTKSFRLPDTAPVGNTRMRVGVGYGVTNLTFEAAVIGCFEDYGIDVGRDLVKPNLALNGPSVLRMEVNTPYVEPGVTASDNLEGNISGKYQVLGSVNINQVGYYELKYYVSDLYGNTSDTVVRIVQVEINQTGPRITLNGSDTMRVGVFTTFSDPGATATDNLGNNISNQVVRTGNLDLTQLGYYTLTYTIRDAFGFVANRQRVVEVIDTIKPVISKKASTPMIEHQIGTAYMDADYVEVTDNYWKNLTPTRTGTVNINVPGQYTLVYTSTDGSGNVGIPLIATVNVRDRIAPTARLKGLEEMEVEVFGTFNDPGVDATDNYYPNVTIQTTSTLNMNVLGVYTITYNVCDAASNCVTLTRTVRVVDKVRPVIKLIGEDPYVLPRYTAYVDPGFTVKDNYYPESAFYLSDAVNSSGIVNHIPGSYFVKYNVTDPSGNMASEVLRLVIVEDITTGLNKIKKENGVFVYPNPTTDGIVNIYHSKGSIQKVEVTDVLGRNVLEQSTNEEKLSIDLGSMNKGIYLLRITDAKEQVITIRILNK